MTAVGLILPRIFRWTFLILAVAFAAAALVVALVMLVNPHPPAGVNVGPADVDLMGQPATVALRAMGVNSDFLATAFQGNVTISVEKANGLVDVFKHYGLPYILANLVFLALLFELLRRLFRNVGRGESFSRDTIRLVQLVAGLLIVFSFISSFGEGLFAYQLFGYLAQHATLTVTGTPVHFPSPHYEMLPREVGFPFGSPLFFSGLLVFALSEVFRQGLALRNENELTI